MIDPWRYLIVGYCWTILIETPILLAGLSPSHGLARKFFASLWLTACTYPIVILFLPSLFDLAIPSQYGMCLLLAETFAPVAECSLFYLLFLKEETNRSVIIRDLAAIIGANLASFGFGLIAPAWLTGL